jgi:DNA polymerase-3 subunit epsilon
MEFDVIAVGIAGFAVSFGVFWAFIWLSRRGGKRRRSGPPPLPKTAPVLAPRVAATKDHAALFDWVAERDDWVVLDVETTDLSPKAEIIEIAVIDAYGRTLLDQLVMPRRRLPKTATKEHGIDWKMLKDKPTWPKIADEVAALLQGRPVIVFNAELGLRTLRQTCEAWSLAPITLDSHCAMLAYAAHRDIAEPRPSAEHRRDELAKACADEGIEAVESHRALGDATMTRDLIVEIAARKQLARAA